MKSLINLLLLLCCLAGYGQFNRDAPIAKKPFPNIPIEKKTFPNKVNLLAAKSTIINVPESKVSYKLFSYNNIKPGEIKGVVLLSNYNADLNMNLLNRISQSLANENFITVIIKHNGNQANVKDNNTWLVETNKIDADYKNVWVDLLRKYPGITKQKLVVGGVSFTGFAIGALALSNSWYADIKGIALIAAGCNGYVKIPIINRVCINDPDVDANGNNGGQNLQNILNNTNPAIANKSTCVTDDVCNGHTTSETWAEFFVTSIRKLLL